MTTAISKTDRATEAPASVASTGGFDNSAWEKAQEENPQFVRWHDGDPVMRCSECDEEYWTGTEGITTSDGKELCISCQCALRDLYDDEWQLLSNPQAERRVAFAPVTVRPS